MLPCNMIRSRQPRSGASSSPRTVPLSSFSHTCRSTLRLSPLSTSPNSTHPTQLDTPVPPQPFCFQSYPHAFRHTWGYPSVSTFNSALSTPHRHSCKCPHQSPNRCHSTTNCRPLFSYSCALFCSAPNAISRILNPLRTLCPNHPGWGTHPSVHPFTVQEESSSRPIHGACPARTSRAGIHISKTLKGAHKSQLLRTC